MLYDYQDKKQIYSLDTKPDAPVTSIQWMNPSASPLLVEGTQKGAVFIWSIPTIEKHKQPQIRSSFTAFPAFAKSAAEGQARSTSLLLDWNQHSGLLAAAGSTQIVKIWDVETEKIRCERNTASSVGCAAIKSVSANAYFCCLLNGKLLGIDTRMKNMTSLYTAGIGEKSRVVGMRVLENSVLLGDFSGTMRVVVGTSLNSEIVLANREGERMQSIRVLDGFRALSLGQVLSCAMHPIDSAIACYNSSGIVYVYK